MRDEVYGTEATIRKIVPALPKSNAERSQRSKAWASSRIGHIPVRRLQPCRDGSSTSRRKTADDHRLLELLAGSANGATDALLTAQGFAFDFMVDLVRRGLVTAQAERSFAGGKPEIARVKITEAGRRVVACRGCAFLHSHRGRSVLYIYASRLDAGRDKCRSEVLTPPIRFRKDLYGESEMRRLFEYARRYGFLR
jgi:hypothetical protein